MDGQTLEEVICEIKLPQNLFMKKEYAKAWLAAVDLIQNRLDLR